ncbi:MAG: TaqI-like C-terminal specificity domain-containing protein [Candidatus Hatepunaea meridiana]|nr:TaqI-like C-terminal specificity domain-containing protein [Candidatus Hatepunaea meridiana]
MNNKNNYNPNQTSLDPVIGESLFETKGIFSEHYLNRWLTDSPHWLKDADVKESFEAIREIINSSVGWIWNLNEQQFRIEFLDKILLELDYYTIPENITPAVGKGTPDYLVFGSENTKNNAYEIKDPRKRYSEAVTCLEAKKYNHNLGEVSKKETPGRFPHRQIREYLEDAWDESARRPYFKWAVLTNGKEWRLYHRDSPTTSYFSLNLERAVKDLESFKYFYVLFHVNAFTQDENRICRLDRILTESLDKQAKLEKDLRLRIFKVLEILASGFYNHHSNKISNLDTLYRTCLIFLYRLLFILYAEGRGLLPVKTNGAGSNKRYRERFSLARLRERLQDEKFSPDDDVFARLYVEINDLFDLINGSEIQLNKYSNVPRYNGGLFDPEKHPELKQWKVGDWTLREVIKGLMFAPFPTLARETMEVDFKERIDYSDLDVRQLGTIYEGLLEHSLKVSGKGKLTLMEDKTGRRSSGSYYTPDYIVKYIVKETVKPLLDRIEKSDAVSSAIQNELHDNSYALQALNLKILDPSMGSGHFLVRAAEYLAEEIAYHPTTKLAVEKKPRDESQDIAEINYWKRRVVESCIYGVDLNDMAVELAKLSLWLTCISSTKPLSYLDHHLRFGNSLVGSTIDELNRLKSDESDSLGLYEVKGIEEALDDAVSSLNYIKEKASENVEDVKEKELKWKEEVHFRLSPYRTIADMRSAFEVGLKIEEDDYKTLAVKTLRSDRLSKPFKELLKKVNYKKAEFNFFHWQLEFPDVFRDGSEGFDIVMGNPPYVRSGNIGQLKSILKKKYQVYVGNADLYTYFIEKGIDLLRSEGRFGMIVSNKWMRTAYGENLRKFVKQYQIEKLVDFGELPVFESSSTFPLIITISRKSGTVNPFYAPIKKIDEENLDTDVKSSGFSVEDNSLATTGFTLVKPDAQRILDQMNEAGTPLGQYVDGKIYYGIKTGFNKAFIIDKRTSESLINADPASAEIIKPFVIGDDVRKYQINYRERYLIFTRRGIDIDAYPVIKKHLQKWEKELTPKIRRGDPEGRKPGDYKWYEIQDNVAFWKEFEKNKIVGPDISKESRFAFDDGIRYFDMTCFILPTEDIYLLGVLNSSPVWKYLSRICSILGDPDNQGRIRLKRIYLDKIPIPSASSRDSGQITDLVKTILGLKQEHIEALGLKQQTDIEDKITECEREIDRIVNRLYGLKE